MPLHKYDPHAILHEIMRRRRRRWIQKVLTYTVPILFFLFIALVVFVVAGCCSTPIAESTSDLKREFSVYQRAVVPNPAYDEQGAAKVLALGERIAAHIAAIEQAARGKGEAKGEDEEDER